jgi:hypothetical protein
MSNTVSTRARELARQIGRNYDDLSAADRATLNRRADEEVHAAQSKPLKFERPSNWDKLSASEKRTAYLMQQNVEADMRDFLRGLPPATSANKAEIDGRLAALSKPEREAFDRVLKHEVGR